MRWSSRVTPYQVDGYARCHCDLKGCVLRGQRKSFTWNTDYGRTCLARWLPCQLQTTLAGVDHPFLGVNGIISQDPNLEKIKT